MDAEHFGQPHDPEFSGRFLESESTPHSFAYADFEETLRRPELGPRSEDVRGILAAIGKFGRAALERGDSGEYEKWINHATDMLDQIQLDPGVSYSPGQFYADLAGVYFQGAMGGNAEATERLSELLESDESGNRLNWVVRRCAEAGVPPDGWINRFAKPLGSDEVDPDRRAKAWGQYVWRAKELPESRGEKPVVDVDALAGMSVVRDDFVEGNLSLDTAMVVAPTLYGLETSVSGKEAILGGYRRAVQDVTLDTESESQNTPYYLDRMANFGTTVIDDADLPIDSKRELAGDILAHNEHWGGQTARKNEALLGFEVAVQVLERRPPDEIVRNINRVAASRTNDKLRAVLTDGLLKHAAEAYSGMGNAEASADMVARIDRINTWTRALEGYAQNGGNPDKVLHLDMRSVMPDSPEWEMRKKRAAIISAMTSGRRPGGDAAEGNQRAGSLLYELAQEDAEREKKDYVTPQYVAEAVRKLAARDADVGGATAHKIVEKWRESDHEPAYQEQVLRVMLDYKAPDAVSEYWAFVETHRVAPDVDFERYAEALLAEATA